jgi:PleD family two-component response regulator
MLLAPCLREEDIMARYDDTVLAFLLPDLPGATAKETIRDLQERIAATSLEMEESGVKLNLQGAAGVVAYQDKSLKLDELLEKTTRAMEGAEVSAYDKVYLLSEHENGQRRSRARVASNGVKQ